MEGLRLDEAMHPLTILAVGLYGEVLPNQNGAPIRLVVPWKYGFKSIKSIVKMRFVERPPVNTGSASIRRRTGSMPTSIRPWIIPTGARRASRGCLRCSGRRGHCRSTATPIKSSICMPEWI